jgi:hypothetical protein
MSTRIVNLRTRRKQMARDADRKKTTGAAPFVVRPERSRAEAENRRARERLEGHRREDPPSGDR